MGSEEVQASSGEGFGAAAWSMVALLELSRAAQAQQKPPAQGRGHARPFSGKALLLPAPTIASGSYPEASRLLGFSAIFLLGLPSLLRWVVVEEGGVSPHNDFRPSLPLWLLGPKMNGLPLGP